MLNWLARYANLVQAVDSLVSVLVTIVLAGITYQYVRLTQRIVEQSDAQLAILRESANARINTLAGQVRTLQLLLEGLPVDQTGADRIHTAPLWNADNIADLQRLTAEHSRRAGELASEIVPSLKWLRDRVGNVKDAGHVDWTQFPWSEWTLHYQRVQNDLNEISALLPGDDEQYFRRRTDRKPTPP